MGLVYIKPLAQTTGQSTTNAMSQKATSDKFTDNEGRITTLEETAYDTLWIDLWENILPLDDALNDGEIGFQTSDNTLWCLKNDGDVLQWLSIPLSIYKLYINRNTNTNLVYGWSGSDMVAVSSPLTKVVIENLLYNGSIALSDLVIDLNAADVVTKTIGNNTQFTITNPKLFKPFRLILTGGTLQVPTFNGYTATWMASTLVTDYVPTSSNVLYCEIRSAGTINLFWGE
jgi:hypothetical protein